MTQVSRTTLKTYFNAGDVPTESQFGDLIDSAVNVVNDIVPPTTLVAGDANKVVAVKSDHTGYELIANPIAHNHSSPTTGDAISFNGVNNHTHISSATGGVIPFRGCLLTSGAGTETVPDGSSGVIVGNSGIAWVESFDTNAFHDTITNRERITIPAGVNYVRLSGSATFDNTGKTSGIRTLQFYKSGSPNRAVAGGCLTVAAGSQVTTGLSIVSNPIAVSAGDYFWLVAYQSNGSGTIPVSECTFAIEVLG